MESITIIILLILLFTVLAFVLIPIRIGQYYGSVQVIKTPELAKSPIGTVVGTAFGLLAFIMAFTFQIASSRYDARKKLLLDEVTAIRTVNLRAGFLPDTYRVKAKSDLLEYVTLQSKLSEEVTQLEQNINQLNNLLDTLWRDAERLALSTEYSGVHNTYITALNSLIDIHNQRLTIALEYRIPSFIKIILAIIIFCAMFSLGFYFGISGKNYFRATFIYGIIFSLVILLILILDHPEYGLSTVNQQPILLLQNQMKTQSLNGF